jgi:hypothetical protein
MVSRPAARAVSRGQDAVQTFRTQEMTFDVLLLPPAPVAVSVAVKVPLGV